MYQDFFVYSAEALSLTASSTQILRTNIDADADFEIHQLVASAISRNFRAKLSETTSGRLISDVGLPGAGAFGDGRHPFNLPVTKRLKPGSTLQSEITDESAATNQVRLAFIGAKLYPRWPFPRPEYVAREFFAYTAPFVATSVDPAGAGTIPANGTGIFQIRIQEDADFEIRQLSIVHDLAIPAALDSLATIFFTEESYGYRFMDRPIPIESLGAARIVDVSPSGFFPFRLRVPKLLRHGSVLSVTARNLDTANALTMRVTFYGAKLYAKAQAALQ